MKFVPYIGLALVALAAVAFVVLPLWRTAESRKARALLAGAVTLFVLGIGGGVYWVVGEPQLALRAALGTESREIGALAPMLIERVRKNPDDEQAWFYLARIYITAGDAGQAAGAIGHAVEAGRRHGRENPDLYTAQGELLIQANNGQVTPAALNALNAALRLDPKNAPARYYLGMAAAQKGDNSTAAKYWQSLLADLGPDNTQLRSDLTDRLASLGAATARVTGKDGAPDPMAMVASLAARLKQQPNDPPGWLRLIRAYTVLGETEKAKEALATARKTVGMDATVKAALDSQAKELKLE